MKRKLLLFGLIAVMLCSGMNVLGANDEGFVFLTVEKITLGQGLIVAPVKVGYHRDDSLADIIERALRDRGLWLEGASSSYLEHVVDGGEPIGWTKEAIPSDIQSALNNPLRGRMRETVLSSYDYTNYGGWMITVDNISPNLGAGDMKLGEDSSNGTCFAPGSVIRLQYSIYGYGEDLGVFWGEPTIKTENTFPDRSNLIRKTAWLKPDSALYQQATSLLTKWQVSKQEVSELEQEIDIALGNADQECQMNTSVEQGMIMAGFTAPEGTVGYLALYNNMGKLLSVKQRSIGEQGLFLSLEEPKEEYTYKCFLWTAQLVPLLSR